MRLSHPDALRFLPKTMNPLSASRHRNQFGLHLPPGKRAGLVSLNSHCSPRERGSGVSPSQQRLLWVGLGVAVVLGVAVQFIPTQVGPPNPAVVAEPPWNSPATRDTFFQACGDCHSNLTQWPWYSYVAPVSWLIARDVVYGRERLNVSEWNRPQRRADEAANAVLEGEMPLPIYLIMHPDARLTSAERDALANGLAATFGG